MTDRNSFTWRMFTCDACRNWCPSLSLSSGLSNSLADAALVRTHWREPCSSLHLLSVKQNTNQDMVPTAGENKGTGLDHSPALRMQRAPPLCLSPRIMPSDRFIKMHHWSLCTWTRVLSLDFTWSKSRLEWGCQRSLIGSAESDSMTLAG